MRFVLFSLLDGSFFGPVLHIAEAGERNREAVGPGGAMWRSDSETASGRGATPSSVRGDSLHTRAHRSTNVNEYSLWRQRERREELFCDSYKGSTAPRAVSSMAKVLLAKTSSASNSSSCNLNEPKRSCFLHWLPHTQINSRWKKQIHLTCIILLNQKGDISEWQAHFASTLTTETHSDTCLHVQNARGEGASLHCVPARDVWHLWILQLQKYQIFYATVLIS